MAIGLSVISNILMNVKRELATSNYYPYGREVENNELGYKQRPPISS